MILININSLCMIKVVKWVSLYAFSHSTTLYDIFLIILCLLEMFLFNTRQINLFYNSFLSWAVTTYPADPFKLLLLCGFGTFSTRPGGVGLFPACLDALTTSQRFSHSVCLWLKLERDFVSVHVLACSAEKTTSPSIRKDTLQTHQVTSWQWCRTIQLNLLTYKHRAIVEGMFLPLSEP